MSSYVEQLAETSVEKVVAGCFRQINEKITNMKKLNIIVMGKSGVGKSTLINAVFREDYAETGIGRPVTQSIRKFEKKDVPLVIFDTPGFELAREQQESVKDEILHLIRGGVSAYDDEKNIITSGTNCCADINESIHCIWYCINVGANRIDPAEITWLKEFTEENKLTQVPVFVILTQACPKKKALEMQRAVEAENLHVCKVIPILAEDVEFDEEHVIQAYGLETLIQLMAQILPDELQPTLQNVQKVSLEMKKKSAHAAVTAAVTASVAAAAAPIPFSDAALLIPTQVSMLASITVVFGLGVNKSLLTCVLSSAIGSGGATLLGRTVAANLAKFIPGGNVAGAAISAATAGTITAALGETYIKIMEMIFLGEMNQEDFTTSAGKQKITELFQHNLRAGKNK